VHASASPPPQALACHGPFGPQDLSFHQVCEKELGGGELKEKKSKARIITKAMQTHCQSHAG